MGWLRLVRPGSVIGRQQHYLCGAEEEGRLLAGGRRPAPSFPRGAAGRRSGLIDSTPEPALP